VSDFYQTIPCPICEEETEHHFMDDTPIHHHYTATCRICGFLTHADMPDYEVQALLLDIEGYPENSET
jgi:uncharacterized Zn finger protein